MSLAFPGDSRSKTRYPLQPKIYGYKAENEILPTNPCVEHFTHISPYILKSVGLTARQLAFLAFVVAPVELIYDEVLDVF